MITVYNAMLVTLGALISLLAVLLLMPAYRRRIERFTHEQIKRSLPLTENEIRADKDRLRAEFAIEVHKLERKLEEAAVTASRQSVEVNRRDARITELEQRLENQKTDFEEHQNARRVLEQTILDRLPKVEARLAEARRMLLQRDGEIATLTETRARQAQALEQATQINVQMNSEVDRLRSALETRAARNREAIGDPRFDGEVALRTEIEALRAKTRDQAQMIDRLQAGSDDNPADLETERLRAALARAEAEVLSLRSEDGTTQRISELEEVARTQEAEISRLKASLHAYEDGAAPEVPSGGLAAKAEINALQAEVDEQRNIIDALRADLAASNERLARQTQHFRDEMRRLSVQQESVDDGSPFANRADPPRRSLAERIAQPRVPRSQEAAVEIVGGSAKFLKAVNGGAEAPPEHEEQKPEAQPSPRRARLLERISNLDKSSSN